MLSPRVPAVTLTKVDSASHVRLLAGVVDELGAERNMALGHTQFLLLVDAAEAFFRLPEIARAHPRVAAMGSTRGLASPGCLRRSC